jgi:hypothetical protein
MLLAYYQHEQDAFVVYLNYCIKIHIVFFQEIDPIIDV